MDFDLTDEEKAAVKKSVGFFARAHKGGTYQDAEDVCSFVVAELKSKGYDIPSLYVENMWIELTSEILEKEQAKEDAERKISKYRQEWAIVKRQAIKYLKDLPPAPKLDTEAAREILGEDMPWNKILDCNGRVYEVELTKAGKGAMRKLEDAKHMKLIEVRFTHEPKKRKKKGKKKKKKDEPFEFRAFYYEPTGKRKEAEPEADEYAVYADDSMWRRANGGRA